MFRSVFIWLLAGSLLSLCSCADLGEIFFPGGTHTPTPRPTPAPLPVLWILGEQGESCDEVCQAQGFTCDLSAIQADSVISCFEHLIVLDALGDSLTGEVLLSDAAEYPDRQLGCSVINLAPDIVGWYLLFPASCTSAAADTQRACACKS